MNGMSAEAQARAKLRARLRAKRIALLLLALAAIAMSLVACGPAAASDNGLNLGNIAISTPNAGQLTPTPTFPPFTVGAWPSNYSPGIQDTVTIYVLCRVQPAAMTGPSEPPSAGSAKVTVTVGPPLNLSPPVGTTDADGLAAIPVTYNDGQAGLPVTVQVVVNYQNQTYTTTTFFTPAPTATLTPTPAPGQTPPSASPTATATP